MRLLLLLLAFSVCGGNAACSCTMDGVAGTFTKQCLDDMDVVTCNSGQIFAKLSSTPGNHALFDKATCVHGMWFGTTCDGLGTVYFVNATTPFFGCPDVVPATTTTVSTTTNNAPVVQPCNCAYTDDGARLNLEAPVSFCADKTQKLQCDGKISAMNEADFVEYDSVSCTNGQWSGTGCDGVPQAFNTASVTVKCATKEPPLCPQIPPSTEGLKYIGTVNGMQRYTCEGDELAKHTLRDSTINAKYIGCNATSYHVRSSDEKRAIIALNTASVIDKITCRDYGNLAPTCSIPTYMNAWLHDGKLECIKGTYLSTVKFKMARQDITLLAPNSDHAICTENGWNITGTTQNGVQVYYFMCDQTPTRVGSCGDLVIPRGNVQYTPEGSNYFCWSALGSEGAERLEVVTATDTYSGYGLQCVRNMSGPSEFKLTGKDPVTGPYTVTVPAGSKVSCKPFQTPVLPPFPTSLPLVPVGVGSSGLTRWACIDSTLKIDLELDQIERYPLHSPYIETNSTFYQVISSVGLMPSKNFNQTINSISCEDMGSKLLACTDPVDLGGIRVGNRYECMKGFYLMTVLWIDAGGARQSHDASTTDSKSLQCKRDGWTVEGTSLSALKVINVHCYPAHALEQSAAGCSPTAIDAEHYKLQYDSFRKYFTCYAGESIAYTLGGVRTYGAGKKLFCGTNAATSAREWQWSLMDETENAAIPLGAKISCF